MDSQIERARQTLRAMGVAETQTPRESLGREDAHGPGSPTRASRLPTSSIGSGGDEDFVVLGQLGRGGMASVYLAEQRSLGREIALKRLHEADSQGELLLLREAAITGGLEHPNIVPVHAVTRDELGPAVVMKRVSGVPWEELLLRGSESIDRQLDIFVQVCNAVAFAHSRGYLHLDIKPSNVMIGEFGEVYLMDWGLARHVDEPSIEGVCGTPCYLAPEMTLGEAYVESDVFLLGATLYEVLTGWVLYDAEDAVGALAMAMACEPPEIPEDISEELAQICRRACTAERTGRFASAAELRDAVTVYREHRTAADLCATASERGARLQALTSGAAGNTDENEREQVYAEAQTLFDEARFAYEQALKTWPDGEDALWGLRRTRCQMIEFELELGHVDAAASLLQTLRDPPPELKQRVDEALTAADHADERLAELERDADPNVGAEGRIRAYLTLAASVLVMTGVLAVSRATRPNFSPSPERLAYVGATVLAAMSIVAWLWRRSGWNLVNRRIALITLAILSMSLVNRLAGAVTGVAAPQILISDALLLALGGMGLSLFHPLGRWLTMLSLGAVVTGVLWPVWIDDVFVGLSILVPALVLLLRRPRAERA